MGDQTVYEADIVGYDEDKDVAVLHIDAPEEELRPLPVGTSYDLLVGQKVFAIGNPVLIYIPPAIFLPFQGGVADKFQPINNSNYVVISELACQRLLNLDHISKS